MSMLWPKDIASARELQVWTRELVRIEPLAREPQYVAGADAAFAGDSVFGAVCVYRYPEMHPVERAFVHARTRFPYVPGYLLFREGPAMMSAFRKLRTRPDLLLADGQGIAHPLGIGSASHLGILLDIPTIGCAKTRLVGDFQDPGKRRGDHSTLRYEGNIVGAVLRTRTGVRPLFVSPGHRVNIADAIRIVLQCAGRFRIPEPLRCAHMLSRRMMTEPEGKPSE